MTIEIVNKDGDLLTDFELESNPFKVGEIIDIRVWNYDKMFWNVKEINAKFIIEKIEHFLRQDYTAPKSSTTFHTTETVFTTSIQVSPI